MLGKYGKIWHLELKADRANHLGIYGTGEFQICVQKEG